MNASDICVGTLQISFGKEVRQRALAVEVFAEDVELCQEECWGWRLLLFTPSDSEVQPCYSDCKGGSMTKFYDANVDLVHYKTVAVQIAADSDAEATKLATEAAIAKEPQFSPTGMVELKFVGESDIKVGSRVFHRLFGAGIVEQMTPSVPSGGFIFMIKFDKGEPKNIYGPGAVLRPEVLANHDPRTYPHYTARFRWERIAETLEVVGTAVNTKDRVDPALFEVLIWCRQYVKDGQQSTVEVKYAALINDEATAIQHGPHLTYTAKLTFNSEDSLIRFFLMWKD